MSEPRSLVNFLSLISFTAFISVSVPAAADSKAEACERLADEIRVRVDRIISGDPMPRLIVALEAHERLECPVDDLLLVLGLPAASNARVK